MVRNNADQISWVLERRLARSSRPGYASPRVLPEVVDRWLDEAVQKGIKSIICLLGADEFYWYPRLSLLDRYKDRGFEVRHVPIPDLQHPPMSQLALEQILKLYREGPRPALVHCNAGKDRTSAAVRFIKEKETLRFDLSALQPLTPPQEDKPKEKPVMKIEVVPEPPPPKEDKSVLHDAREVRTQGGLNSEGE